MMSDTKKRKHEPEKSSPGRKELFTPEEVIDAIQKARGIKRYAAKNLGCHRQTLTNMAKRYPEVAEALEEAREEMIDTAEGKLLEAISRGEFPAIRFFLACQAKHRGYVERSEVTGAGGKPVVPAADLSRLTENELKTLALLQAKIEGVPQEEVESWFH